MVENFSPRVAGVTVEIANSGRVFRDVFTGIDIILIVECAIVLSCGRLSITASVLAGHHHTGFLWNSAWKSVEICLCLICFRA